MVNGNDFGCVLVGGVVKGGFFEFVVLYNEGDKVVYLVVENFGGFGYF